MACSHYNPRFYSIQKNPFHYHETDFLTSARMMTVSSNPVIMFNNLKATEPESIL